MKHFFLAALGLVVLLCASPQDECFGAPAVTAKSPRALLFLPLAPANDTDEENVRVARMATETLKAYVVKTGVFALADPIRIVGPTEGKDAPGEMSEARARTLGHLQKAEATLWGRVTLSGAQTSVEVRVIDVASGALRLDEHLATREDLASLSLEMELVAVRMVKSFAPPSRLHPSEANQTRSTAPEAKPHVPEPAELAQDFIREYYHVYEAGDASSLMRFYGPEVDLYEFGVLSKALVRRKFQRFFNQWPVRKNWLETKPLLEDADDPEIKTLTYVLRFTAANEQEEQAGRAYCTLTLRRQGAAFAIISEKSRPYP